MAIDNPLDQAKSRVESDERDRGVALEGISEVSRFLSLIIPIAVPIQSVLESVTKWQFDHTRYLLDETIKRIKEIDCDVEILFEKHRAFVEEEWVKLVLDGVSKAQQARTRQRVKRLGEILAYAYVKGDQKAPGLTEELLRVASGLDEDDVTVLAWLWEGTKEKYDAAIGHVDFESANDFWGQVDQHGRTQSLGKPFMPVNMNLGDVMSCCAKLQAFGLVIQVRRSAHKTAPEILPYSPLNRGREFLEYLRRN